MIVWAGVAALFLIYELYATITKEQKYPTLSRTIWLLLAHRASWQINYGPIPNGLYVLHKCDNPTCVRPNHLFLGTQGDNLNDMYSKERQSDRNYARGTRQHLAKLNDASVREIREMHQEGFSYFDIARVYGVSVTAVGNVVRRETWTHVI